MRYSFDAAPWRVRSLEDARRVGINCISLAHLVTQELSGYELPPELHCSELYRDEEHTVRVDDSQPWQEGDLIWFGHARPKMEPEEFEPVYQDRHVVNWRDFPITHVGIHTGQYEDGQPLLLHATHFEGTNVIWPLHRFAQYRRYSRIYGVKRLRDQAA